VHAVDSVLLAVEFTAASDGPIRRALWLAEQRPGIRVHLVHVIDRRLLDGVAQLGLGVRSEFERRARDAANDALDELAERFAVLGVGEIVSECLCGRPVEELGDAVTAHAPSLVVAGAGLRSWRHVVLGSTARGLLRAVHRPLWLVRGDGSVPIEQVLLPSDLRPPSASAARLAASLWPKAGFELLHVAEGIADMAVGLAGSVPGDVREVKARLEQQARQRLEGFAAEVLPGCRVSTRLEPGHPVGVALRRARDSGAQLLAMGRSGRRGIEAAVLGSVAEALVELVDCDLLLVPADEALAEGATG
jgi:nucleotide-binding universal stress UspA family protein